MEMQIFLEKNLFPTESLFVLENQHVNTQNARFWSSSLPSEALSTVKQFPKINDMVWLHSKLSYWTFFTGNVNATTYQDMLHTFVIPQLKRKQKFSNTVFKQDGAT